MAEGDAWSSVAKEDLIVELSSRQPCLAAGSQWLHPSRPRLYRSCDEQEGGNRAGLSPARCELPALGDGSLPAQPALRERDGRGETSRPAMAGHRVGGE